MIFFGQGLSTLKLNPAEVPSTRNRIINIRDMSAPAGKLPYDFVILGTSSVHQLAALTALPTLPQGRVELLSNPESNRSTSRSRLQILYDTEKCPSRHSIVRKQRKPSTQNIVKAFSILFPMPTP
jgi:hypothetical protein